MIVTRNMKSIKEEINALKGDEDGKESSNKGVC